MPIDILTPFLDILKKSDKSLRPNGVVTSPLNDDRLPGH
jgi:hypothetical protein